MSGEPKPKSSLLQDTILFIVMLPVMVIVASIMAFVVPVGMAIFKMLGLVDREPKRPNRN
jgi:ABC-type bacteriocin/lantibiotic exporter with double-glycine peptidase domain